MRVLRLLVPPLCLFAAICSGQGTLKNVLLLVADDQGLDLGCYGNRAIQTPNLDRLAAEGVRFSHAFASVASCSASRSVILTGLYNHTNGQFGHAHDPANLQTHPWVESVPRLLQKHGYVTGVIGKLHVNPEAVYTWDYQGASPGAGGGNRNVWDMAQKARQFFTKYAGKPFYLHVGYSDPHRAAKGFGNDKDYPGVRRIAYDPAKVLVPAHLPDRPEVRQELAEHYEAISRLDQGVGLILKALEESGLAANTLVLYLSDNGIPFAGAKTGLYDAGVRLPLLVRSPQLKRKGIVNSAMVSWVDLAPTILEWTGARPPARYQLPGRSFLGILGEENPPGWDAVFLSHPFHEITM
jgi:N-sulfoglucosamine sulfohydrolase